MANLNGLGGFAGGFAKAYFQAKIQKEAREDAKKERDAKMKLYELQLKKEQAGLDAAGKQTDARDKLFELLAPSAPSAVPPEGATPGINPMAGGGAAKPSLTELLADPKAALLLLQSGLGNVGDLSAMQGQAGNQALIQRAMGGGQGGAPGGMELSGLKLDSSGKPMLDFQRREVKRWLPSPDGRFQIGLDAMGNELTRVPAGPGDRAVEDVPMTPDRLAEFRTPDGKMLPPGTTLRQAQQIGAVTAPKPAEADKKAVMLLKGMQDAEATISELSGADTASVSNAALATNPVTKMFTSQSYKKYEAAGKRWAQNYLYLKSGAQASEKEVETTFRTYFPQPGEGDEVKAQKEAARKQEISNVSSTYSATGQGPARVIDFKDLPR